MWISKRKLLMRVEDLEREVARLSNRANAFSHASIWRDEQTHDRINDLIERNYLKESLL